jgi:hypothetical protein
MKSKSLFFIFLMVCLVFFLTGCDSGGGGSSGGGGGDDNKWPSNPFTSTWLDDGHGGSGADTTFKLKLEGKGDSGKYTITKEGVGEVSSGTITVTSWGDSGSSVKFKYKEQKYYEYPSGPLSNVPSGDQVERTITIDSPTMDFSSYNGATITFDISN